MAEDVFQIAGTVQAGDFRVERAVAEGGFGVVYRAQHGAFRAPVALKCLKVPGEMSGPQRETFLEKFREEAELLFRLSASIPEVVRPLQVGVLDVPGRFVPFLALEWLEGESLDRIVDQRNKRGQAPIAIHKLVKMLQPLAQALARAHRFPGPNGPVAIIHRDLKPDNVFVADVGGTQRVKILDFGIAKVKSATTAIAGHHTGGAGLNAFTPAYAAPEQWLPKRFGQTGPWTDVWGLAITMVEVLAGYPPIEGDVAAMMAMALDEIRRPTPRSEGVVVSNEVERAFERALIVDPRHRSKDIETFWTELEVALGVAPTFAPHDSRRDSPGHGGTRIGLSDPPAAPLPRSEQASAQIRGPVRDPSPASPAPEIPDIEIPRVPTLDATPPRAAAPAQAAASKRPEPKRPPMDSDPDLEPIPLADFALAAEPRSMPRQAPRDEPPRFQSMRPTVDLKARLRGPVRLVVLAVAISIADTAYFRSTGELLLVVGLRPIWFAGPIALLGVALACLRLFGDD